MTADGSLSGRAAGRRVRGRLQIGTDIAGRVRLEAVAPFGAPVFILAADTEAATLFLPRDGRVVRDATVADLLAAISGVPLTGQDLHAALVGCGLARREVGGGRSYGQGWWSVDLGDGGTAWLRSIRDGPPQLVAARTSHVTLEYGEFADHGPRAVRFVAADDPPRRRGVDLTLRLAAVDVNVELPPDAFHVQVPADARPMSLDELRQIGLLTS
jgi:hypothetical protein